MCVRVCVYVSVFLLLCNCVTFSSPFCDAGKGFSCVVFVFWFKTLCVAFQHHSGEQGMGREQSSRQDSIPVSHFLEAGIDRFTGGIVG